MEIFREQPDLFVYDIGRNKLEGIIGAEAYNMSLDLKFATASEMKFTINKYYYDETDYTWKESPYYKLLTEHKIIATNDTAVKYKFRRNYLMCPEFIDDYTIPYIHNTQDDRFITGESSHASTFNVRMNQCELQGETLLFDIGTDSGYTWKSFSKIDNNGGLIQVSPDGAGSSAFQHNLTCPDFIPVSSGDIIALTSRVKNAPEYEDMSNTAYVDGYELFKYSISYYKYNDSSSFIKKVEHGYFNPVGRIRIKDGDFNTADEINGEEETLTSGFIRIEIYSEYAHDTSGGEHVYIYPAYGYIQVYSGERRCVSFDTQSSGTNNEKRVNERWWVVDSVESENTYDNAKKTVTLKSYEYTLSRKLFSLDEGINPLYIPDSLVNVVQSKDMIVDYRNGTRYKTPQRMNRGIINQLLDYIPEWSVGSISGALACKYRKVSAVDNGNIYSFLTNTIQSTYNCYVIFDSDKREIHFLSSEDVFSYGSKSVLGWQNVLKSVTIENEDSNYVTALKGSFSDATYGLGLVNPQGNNSIYNFDHIKDGLNFVVDPGHTNGQGVPYTLKNRIEVYKDRINSLLNGTYPKPEWQSSAGFIVNGKIYTYPELYRLFVNLTLECTKLQTKVQEKLYDYHEIVDKINVHIGANGNGEYSLSDAPLSVADIDSPSGTSGKTAAYYSMDLYRKLRDAAKTYWDTYNKFKNRVWQKNQAYKHMQWVARRLSVIPSVVAKAIANGESPVFTEKEALYLNNYIIEGEWKNSNMSFSETYTADDIINTLKDAYNNMVADLALYSKPIYSFKIGAIDIFGDPDLSETAADIYMGNYINIDNNGQWVQPVLLEVHVDFADRSNGSLSLSTDYKRKPLDIRFSDMFKTIQQTNVTTPQYTFDN